MVNIFLTMLDMLDVGLYVLMLQLLWTVASGTLVTWY